MQRMHTFLEESDDASLRARHHRRAREMASQMSRTTLQDTGTRVPDVSSRSKTSRRSGSRARKSTPSTTLQNTGSRAPDVSSQPRTSRRSGSRARKSTPPTTMAVSSEAPGVVRSHRSNPQAVPALMGLALPRFASPDGPVGVPVVIRSNQFML